MPLAAARMRARARARAQWHTVCMCVCSGFYAAGLCGQREGKVKALNSSGGAANKTVLVSVDIRMIVL